VRSIRRELIVVAAAILLVVAAFVVPHLSMGLLTPLIHASPQRIRDYAQTAPIFGWWNAHVGWGTLPAIVIAATPSPHSTAAAG